MNLFDAYRGAYNYFIESEVKINKFGELRANKLFFVMTAIGCVLFTSSITSAFASIEFLSYSPSLLGLWVVIFAFMSFSGSPSLFRLERRHKSSEGQC